MSIGGPSLPHGATPDSPIFVISVAAELAGLHAQTLRSYDRLGLVQPRPVGRWWAALLRA